MRPDLYTKIVLTVIAMALVALVFRPTLGIQKAYASGRTVDVNIVEIAGKDIKTKLIGGADGALPITTGVDLIGNTVPIAIVSGRRE